MDDDQTTLDNNVDLYEDLHELFSSTRSVTDCNLSYAELQEKLKEKETQLNTLKLEVKQLAEQNICLKKNISCLFKTAKNELQYKEKQINLLHARLIKKPGRKARKRKTPKNNNVLVTKASDGCHKLSTTRSNKTISTNSATNSANNETIGIPVTSSSSATQCNAISTAVIPNDTEVVTVPSKINTSESETDHDENTLSSDIPVVTEDSQAVFTTISSSSAGEEVLNNTSPIIVPAEMSEEVELTHDNDCCDNVSETVSVSDGEILSEDEQGNSHATGSCDVHNNTNITCDHNVLSHGAATSSSQNGQGQSQGNHRDQCNQSQNQGNHRDQSGQRQGNHRNQSGRNQNPGNHRGHRDQCTNYSDRESDRSAIYDRPASQGISRSISEPHSSHGSRRTTRNAAMHQSSNEAHEPSTGSCHTSSRSHDSLRSRSSRSHDYSKTLHHSSSKSHNPTTVLHRSLSESHDPSTRLDQHSSESHEIDTSKAIHRSSGKSHDSSNKSHCNSSGSHDPLKTLHHNSSGSHDSSKELHRSSRRSLDSTRSLRHSFSELHDPSGQSNHQPSGSQDSSKRLNNSSIGSYRTSHSPHNSSKRSSHSLGASQVSSRPSKSRDSCQHTSGMYHDSLKQPSHGSHDPSKSLYHSSSRSHNSSRRSSDHSSKELHNSSKTLHHSSTVSRDSPHRNLPQGAQHNSTPDQRRTSDSGITRGSKRRYSNQDTSRDTLPKRRRSSHAT